MTVREAWLRQAHMLRLKAHGAYFVLKDPRVPWYARVVAGCAVGYSVSPIQLIPDFIPVFGFLDDFVVLALGLKLVYRLTPKSVLTDCHERAEAAIAQHSLIPSGAAQRIAAVTVLAIWIVGAVLLSLLIARTL